MLINLYDCHPPAIKQGALRQFSIVTTKTGKNLVPADLAKPPLTHLTPKNQKRRLQHRKSKNPFQPPPCHRHRPVLVILLSYHNRLSSASEANGLFQNDRPAGFDPCLR